MKNEKEMTAVVGTNQVEQLAEAARTTLTDGGVRALERLADESGTKILGEDMFRFAVKKEAGAKRRGPVSAFMNMTGKPTGALGSLMISGMNSGHAKLADWGMRRLPEDGVEMLLDIGCGGGRNVGELLRRYPSAWAMAVDHSPLSVERTRKYNRAAVTAGRLAVQEESVSALSFAADTFDLATAFETVYFWPGLAECFAEVYRVLKPGGTFLIVNESDGTDAAGKKWEKQIDGMRVYAAAQIAEALHAAGFSGVGAWHHREKPWLAMIAVKKCS